MRRTGAGASSSPGASSGVAPNGGPLVSTAVVPNGGPLVSTAAATISMASACGVAEGSVSTAARSEQKRGGYSPERLAAPSGP